jgi:hypothetical protein
MIKNSQHKLAGSNRDTNKKPLWPNAKGAFLWAFIWGSFPKEQAFMRDSEAPSLRVRVTAAGAKSFVYEAKLNRQTIRRTIGDVKLWSIEQARTEARRLAVTLDSGQDPRELERQQQAEKAAASDRGRGVASVPGERQTQA